MKNTSKNIISSFLRNIPLSSDAFKDSNTILEKMNGKSKEVDINTLLAFLSLFNVIDIEEEGQKKKIRANSELATNFLNSLAIYFENDLTLISDWKSKTDNEAYSLEGFFKYGSQFLYQMESRRVNDLGNTIPILNSDTVLLIIKAKIQQSDEDFYLYQFNNESLILKTIGGNRKEGESDEVAIQRIVDREIPMHKLKVNKDFTFKLIKDNVDTYKISIKKGVYSKYNLKFYQVVFTVPILKLTKLDRWVSVSEMKKEKTYDGISLMSLFKYVEDQKSFINILNELPLSLSNVQPYKIKVSKADKNLNLQSSIQDYLNSEESDNLEFKSSARWDYKLQTTNKLLEKVIVKSISGFLNTEGGTLVIGMDDDKNVLGIEKDWNTLPKKNADGYMNYLMSLVGANLGIEFCPFVEITFGILNNKTICTIKVKKSLQPVFFKEGNNREFFIRAGNTTRPLNAEEIYKYIEIHW